MVYYIVFLPVTYNKFPHFNYLYHYKLLVAVHYSSSLYMKSKSYWKTRMHTQHVMYIDPIHKGVSLFLLDTNINKVNSLHHVKEHPQISNFQQFESHRSRVFKVRAISDLRDLYGIYIKIQGLSSLAFMFYTF